MRTIKIIFLDIDGVLNSLKYDMERTATDGNIDPSRLVLLKQIVDFTGAEIVLTSTWRKFWEKEKSQMGETGRELNQVFGSAGLTIFDKTPVLGNRKEEISAWTVANEGLVDSFCIIDDITFGWEEFEPFVVNTNPRIGRGLEEKHVKKAVSILNKEFS